MQIKKLDKFDFHYICHAYQVMFKHNNVILVALKHYFLNQPTIVIYQEAGDSYLFNKSPHS